MGSLLYCCVTVETHCSGFPRMRSRRPANIVLMQTPPPPPHPPSLLTLLLQKYGVGEKTDYYYMWVLLQGVAENISHLDDKNTVVRFRSRPFILSRSYNLVANLTHSLYMAPAASGWEHFLFLVSLWFPPFLFVMALSSLLSTTTDMVKLPEITFRCIEFKCY